MKAAKRCGCGRVHDAASWGSLPHIGDQDDGIDVLDLRNCVCGSTLGRWSRPSPSREATLIEMAEADGIAVPAGTMVV